MAEDAAVPDCPAYALEMAPYGGEDLAGLLGTVIYLTRRYPPASYTLECLAVNQPPGKGTVARMEGTGPGWKARRPGWRARGPEVGREEDGRRDACTDGEARKEQWEKNGEGGGGRSRGDATPARREARRGVWSVVLVVRRMEVVVVWG